MLTGESRLLDMRILQNFVRKTRGRWDADEWGRFIKRVRLLGFMRIDEERIRELVEGNRERWLAGDNSVGPPAPAPVPEPAPAGGALPGPESLPLRRAQLGRDPLLAKPGIPPWESGLAGIDREEQEEAWAAEASEPEEPPADALAPETAAPDLPAAATRAKPTKKTRKKKGAGKAKKTGKAKAGKVKKSKKKAKKKAR